MYTNSRNIVDFTRLTQLNFKYNGNGDFHCLKYLYYNTQILVTNKWCLNKSMGNIFWDINT